MNQNNYRILREEKTAEVHKRPARSEQWSEWVNRDEWELPLATMRRPTRADRKLH